MAEEIIMEIGELSKQKPFYKKRIFFIAGFLFFLILLLAIFSWWLARGKISSVAARLDTMIFTVGSDFPARIKEIFVLAGDQVQKDQPLGAIEAPEFADQLQTAAKELANLRAIAGLPQSNNSDDSAGLIEKEAASKLAQARFDEERLYKIYQESVNDHVRSQLALRAISAMTSPQYGEANANEARMRQKMQQDLENFERASKFRSTLDQALAKIRNAIIRARQSAGLSAMQKITQNSPASFSGISTLASPAQGSVFRINGQPGQIIQPGETVFYILPFQENGKGERWIQAWFSRHERDNIKVGQPVTIKFPDIDLLIKGKVEAIASENQPLPDVLNNENFKIDSLSHSEAVYLSDSYVPVKISIDEDARINDLKPGSRADCQIQTHYIFGIDWL